MWRELSKPWSTFTSCTNSQAECLMIDNEEWVMKKLSKWIGNIPFYFDLNQIFGWNSR